jgi:hypothetical protein
MIFGINPHLPTCLTSKRRQRGSILVEMTLAMPVLIFAGFNMLDLWQFMSEKQVAIDTARAGARWACATQMKGDVLINDADSFNFPMKCNQVISAFEALEPGEPLALDAKAAHYSCVYLRASGLALDKWDINPVIPPSNEIIPGLWVQTVDIEIKQNESSCLGCLRQIALSAPKAASRYYLAFPVIEVII